MYAVLFNVSASILKVSSFERLHFSSSSPAKRSKLRAINAGMQLAAIVAISKSMGLSTTFIWLNFENSFSTNSLFSPETFSSCIIMETPFLGLSSSYVEDIVGITQLKPQSLNSKSVPAQVCMICVFLVICGFSWSKTFAKSGVFTDIIIFSQFFATSMLSSVIDMRGSMSFK